MKILKNSSWILALWLIVVIWLVISATPGTGVGVLGEITEPETITLVAAGDVIMHSPIVDSAYNPTDKSYNFQSIFSGIKDYLSQGDITVAVLETPLNAPGKGYSGYPQFNAPGAIADAMKWSGIDLVFTAHNHSLDQGAAGVRSTMDYLDKIDLPQTGSRRSAVESGYKLVEVKDFKLAFFSVTTFTNGIPSPKGEEWLVNRLNFKSLALDIQQAREAGADAVILALHTGIEYERIPSTEQQQIVERLFDIGVDIVLGSHVHVIQPYELRTVFDQKSNTPSPRFVVYSLGNLLSNQRWRYSDCGLLLTFELQKTQDKTGFTFKKITHQPIWVNRYLNGGRYQFNILKAEGPVYNGNDPAVDAAGKLRIGEVWRETEELIVNWNNRAR